MPMPATPNTVNDETVLAVMEIVNHVWPLNMPARLVPAHEISVVTIAESGYYNVWYLSYHDGQWSENGSHYSHAHSYSKALLQCAMQATEYEEH